MRRLGSALVLSLLLCHAASWTSGPQITTFPSDVDDTDQPFGLYVPKDYDPGRKYPLILMLHGTLSDHRTDLKRLFGKPIISNDFRGASGMWPRFREVDFIVITPHARGPLGYSGIAEKDIWDLVDHVKHQFNIDEDRIYATGIGLGGGAAIWLALSRPGTFAAIMPVSPIPLPFTDDLLPNAQNLPIKVIQGTADPLAKPQDTRALVHRLRESGAQIEYVELPGVRHNAWEQAYRDASAFDWFAARKRDAYPNQVVLSSATYERGRAFWLRFVNLTPGTTAHANARFTARKQLEITTRNLNAFALDLAGHPQASGPGPISLTVDGTKLTATAARPINLSRTAKSWTLRADPPDPGQKAPGSEGPIAAAIASKHLYVYGTLDSPTPEETLRRRDVAQKAADWDRNKTEMLVSFRVLSDAEVRPTDRKGANLILFGTRETNKLVAELAPQLPLHLSPAAADYGLLYITPLDGKRYALISSGLPWWTRVDQLEIGGRRVVPAPFQLLSRFGDFALYRGKGDQVLINGHFTPSWKLSPADAEAFRATGVVSVVTDPQGTIRSKPNAEKRLDHRDHRPRRQLPR